jgi:hypothetical protein
MKQSETIPNHSSLGIGNAFRDELIRKREIPRLNIEEQTDLGGYNNNGEFLN